MRKSVFAKYQAKAYPYMFRAVIHLDRIMGGIPSDPNVAEAWLKTKLGLDQETIIQEAVAEVMAERGVSMDEAVGVVQKNRRLNGFKRDDQGLYIEGRQIKAGIKEAANVRWPRERWGPTNKGTLGFFSEHVFVQEDRVYLGVKEPTGINQKFVHTWRGSGIQYEEYVDDLELEFTVATDYEFKQEQWAMLWLTGENQGLGASRSQGYGRYSMVKWEKIS